MSASAAVDRAGARYSGWKVVAVGFVIYFIAFGAPMTMPLVYRDVMQEFGWSLTQVTLIYTFQNLVAMALALLALGPLIERFGLKRVLVGCMMIESFGLGSFLLIDSLSSYYLAGAMIGIGHGAVIVGVKILITRWFTRNVGLAIGLAIMGTSLGGFFFPLLASQLIPEFGWRVTFAYLSIGVLFVSVPLALWVDMEPTEADIAPEAMRSAGTADTVQALRAAELDYSFRDVLRLPSFWLIAGSTLLATAVDQALFQHTVLYLTEEAGLGRTLAATALSVTFLAGLTAKFVAGTLYDRLSIKGIALWRVLLALAVLLAFPVQGLMTAFLFTITRGLAHGGVVVDGPVVVKHVYGPKYVNRLLPLITGCSAFGSALGPVGLSMIHDSTGSYRYGFVLFVGLALLSALMQWQVRPLYRDRLRASMGEPVPQSDARRAGATA